MGGIQFNADSFFAASESITKATTSMKNAVTSASEVKSVVTTSSASEIANAAATDIAEACSTSQNIDKTFSDWSSLLTYYTLAEVEGNFSVDLGNGTMFVKFDNSIMIYVTEGPESGSAGVGYPLDQYVMGVLDGERDGINWGVMCAKGEITKSQYLNALKAFAIIARSYGLSQTVYNTRFGHDVDHKIQNGSTKQCFNTRLFQDDNNFDAWELMSSSIAAASIETTGIVFGNSERPLPLYYNGGDGQLDKVLEYAKEDMDYITILKKVYPEEFSTGGLKYYDYSTQKIIGDVPDKTTVSKLISKNLSTDKPVDGSTEWTYGISSSDNNRTITVKSGNGVSNETVTNTINEESSSTGVSTVTTGSGGSGTTTGSSTSSGNSTSTTGTSTSSGNSSSTYGSSTSSGSSSTTTGTVTSSGSSTSTTGSSTSSGSSSTTTGTSTSSGNSSIPTTSHTINIFPENKFSEAMPGLSGGNLSSMEISVNHVEYQVNNLSENTYNTYLSKLQEKGYTLMGDGTWVNGSYIISLNRDVDTNQTTISLFMNNNNV